MMVWAIINQDGPLDLVFVEGNIDKDLYLDILKQSIVIKNEFKNDFVFMQDNAAVHTAKKVKNFLEN